ncbi:MAG: hypothetical protein HKN68_15840, partial [Saprospiraceae bacterium]|nr:hypothetical protein [Saprospiraceae bacterium]
MGFKSWAAKPFAHYISSQIRKWSVTAVQDQLNIMNAHIQAAKLTDFGMDHKFSEIKDYETFKRNIPIRDYEGLRSYVDPITEGKSDVLWPGKPTYFAKTSGTTSGVKYIPLTKGSMPNHINGARNALLNYISETGDGSVFDGKVIFLSGSPELSEKGGIATGRLSGIVNHEIPSWIRGNQVPSYETNCIDDWEEKLEKVIDETIDKDMRLIGGIPPWVQMYYERLLERTGKKTVKEVFPNYSLFMYGGVNYEPYRAKLEELVGEKIDSIEMYPASEGFIAFQDKQDDKGLLLNSKSGIFYEFIPAGEVFNENPTRLHLGQVEVGVDYAIIINNNAGLWGYNIGDLVRFVSLDPYKLLVTGRIKHFISAFGEHVIGKEVENALLETAKEYDVSIIEFTVAPQVNPPEGGTPYHEWFVEFGNPPSDMKAFSEDVDNKMREQNIYYDDLISGAI